MAPRQRIGPALGAVLEGLKLARREFEGAAADPPRMRWVPVALVSALQAGLVAALAQLYRALGAAGEQPHGAYAGASLPVGVTWLAGSGLITRYGMSYGTGLGAWAGKFIGDDTQGANIFALASRHGQARARPYNIVRRHRSAFDGLPTTLLDYSSTDLVILSRSRS